MCGGRQARRARSVAASLCRRAQRVGYWSECRGGVRRAAAGTAADAGRAEARAAAVAAVAGRDASRPGGAPVLEVANPAGGRRRAGLLAAVGRQGGSGHTRILAGGLRAGLRRTLRLCTASGRSDLVGAGARTEQARSGLAGERRSVLTGAAAQQSLARWRALARDSTDCRVGAAVGAADRWPGDRGADPVDAVCGGRLAIAGRIRWCADAAA